MNFHIFLIYNGLMGMIHHQLGKKTLIHPKLSYWCIISVVNNFLLWIWVTIKKQDFLWNRLFANSLCQEKKKTKEKILNSFSAFLNPSHSFPSPKCHFWLCSLDSLRLPRASTSYKLLLCLGKHSSEIPAAEVPHHNPSFVSPSLVKYIRQQFYQLTKDM